MTKTHETREAWLVEAADLIRTAIFAEHDVEIPEFRISVGWPGGRGKKSSTIGQCWNTTASEDGIPQVFVSPVVKDRLEVLRVMVHEMIHVLDDCQNGHRGLFVQTFRKVGMTGKATECDASEELRTKLADIAEAVGKYPHGAMKRQVARTGTGEKKQSTRMLLLKAECGYQVRTTQIWIDEGLPTCPHGHEMELQA
jgi:hypothetical protein